jgi:hypothetical protein
MSEQEQTPAENTAAVWPPPPIGATPVTYGRPIYMPGSGLARVIVALLIVGIIFDGVEVLLLAGPVTTGQRASLVVNGLGTLFALVMGICFLVWTHRCYRNLQAFGVADLRYTPAWAVGYFFVPIMNLYRPYQVFKEVWQASDPTVIDEGLGTDWHRAKTPGLILASWLCYIGAGIISGVSSMQGGGNGAIIVGEAALAISSVLAILFIRRLTARQDETAQALS